MAKIAHATARASKAIRSAANMKTFKVTIAFILSYRPVKTFTILAPDIVSAQIRVWRKVKSWHQVIAAEQCVQPTRLAVGTDSESLESAGG